MVTAGNIESTDSVEGAGTMNTIRVIARARIHPGKQEAFSQTAASCLAAARRDPGTQSYEWYLNADHTECVVLEVYDDSNALLAHIGNLGDLFGQLMAVSDLTIELFGDPSPELRQVGGSVGAKIYGYLQGLV
jgi:quinol monooxygenase YgiN